MASKILYSSGRIISIQLILLIGFLALIGRLIYLQIYQDIFLDDQVFNRLDSQYSLLAPRGKILDRNDRVLAMDVKGYSVGIDLAKFNYHKDSIFFLAKILDKDPNDLISRLRNKSSGYKEIKRNINYATKEVLQEKKITGVYFRENLRRSYPEKNISSHIVGLTDTERKGIQGVELVFQNELQGENRATIDVFEPGSVMKPLAMSAIIESGKVDISKKINTSPGWIEFEGFKTSDFRDYGILNPSQIISLSSNVGMVKLCEKQDTKHLINYYKKFGIGKYPTSLMIPAREGHLPHESQFTLRDKVSSCYGYGITLSALQIAQAYSVFANDGNFIELNLFKDQYVGEIHKHRTIGSETNRLIVDMLVETVNSSNGTASKARLKDFEVAGKTGTAKET